MGAIVYGATHGEYSDYRIAALFESEAKAKAWIKARGRRMPCWSCKGTGKWGPDINGKLIKCWKCNGKGTTKGDGNIYSVETFLWNPTGEEED
jgi:DnaJ-class molecular chaperone